MQTERLISVLSVVFIVLIVSGALLDYGTPNYCNIHLEKHTDHVQYSFEAGYVIDYTCLSYVKNDSISFSDVLIYCDDRPAPCNYNVQNDFAYKTIECLRRADIHAEKADAIALRDMMSSAIATGECDTAVIFYAGSLPDEIYDGTPSCLLFQWLFEGGAMYWDGETIGRFVSSQSEMIEIENYSTLFFGIPNVVGTSVGIFDTFSTIEQDSLDYVLDVYLNECGYGIKTSLLSDSIGLTRCVEGYHAVSLTKYHGGEGMIVVIGQGMCNYDTIDDVVQLVASGITYSSVVYDINKGCAPKEKVSGSVNIPSMSDYAVYAFVKSTILNRASYLSETYLGAL